MVPQGSILLLLLRNVILRTIINIRFETAKENFFSAAVPLSAMRKKM